MGAITKRRLTLYHRQQYRKQARRYRPQLLYFVIGNLLLDFVDEFARMAEAGQRRLGAGEPVDVIVECRVETQHVAHVLLEVTLQSYIASTQPFILPRSINE